MRFFAPRHKGGKDILRSGASDFVPGDKVTKTPPGALRPGTPPADMPGKRFMLSFGIGKGLCMDESVQPPSPLPLK